MFTSTRTAAAVAAICGLVGFTGCDAEVSASKTVDTEKGEKVIGEQLTERLGVKVTVACPEDVEAKKGATFECDAKDAEGETATVLVTQKDDDGNIRFEVEE